MKTILLLLGLSFHTTLLIGQIPQLSDATLALRSTQELSLLSRCYSNVDRSIMACVADSTQIDSTKAIWRCDAIDWIAGNSEVLFLITNIVDSIVEPPVEVYTVAASAGSIMAIDDLSERDATHEYRFDPFGINHDTIYLPAYPDTIPVFDQTTKQISHIIYAPGNGSAQDCELHDSIIVDTLVVTFDGELAIPISGDDVRKTSPCDYTVRLLSPAIDNRLQISYEAIGSSFDQAVAIFFEGQSIQDTVHIVVEGQGPPPLDLIFDEVSFDANETIEIAVWFDKDVVLTAFQAGFCIDYQHTPSLLAGVMTSPDLAGNLGNDAGSAAANILWVPNDAQSRSLPAEETLFSIRATPTYAGSTKDIITFGSCGQIIGEAAQIDSQLVEYDLSLRYLFGRRQTSSVEVSDAPTFNLRPNPTTNRIEIDAPSTIHNTAYRIHTLDGRNVGRGTIEERNIDVSDLPNGTYVLSLESLRISQLFVKQ